MAMSIAQIGCVFPFFTQPTFDYLCGVPLESIVIMDEDIPSYEARTLIESVGSNCITSCS